MPTRLRCAAFIGKAADLVEPGVLAIFCRPVLVDARVPITEIFLQRTPTCTFAAAAAAAALSSSAAAAAAAAAAVSYMFVVFVVDAIFTP